MPTYIEIVVVAELCGRKAGIRSRSMVNSQRPTKTWQKTTSTGMITQKYKKEVVVVVDEEEKGTDGRQGMCLIEKRNKTMANSNSGSVLLDR